MGCNSIARGAVCWLFFGMFLLRGGTLAGRVYADTGKPVDKVVVTIQKTVITSPDFQIYRIVTDEQGSFVINLTEPGTYSVCVGDPPRMLLNSCVWSLSSSLVVVGANQNASLRMVLQTGTVLRFRIDDPDKLYSNRGRGLPQAVSIGLAGVDKRQHPVAEVSGDDKGRNYEILVPSNADYNFSIQSDEFDIVDDKGNGVGADRRTSVSSRPADIGKVIRYRVKAKGK